MESSQPTGSFKIRGIGRLCQEMIMAGKQHLVVSSGGNARYTVAWIGRRLGIKTTIFFPKTTNSLFIHHIRSEGGAVQQMGEVWDDDNEAAHQACYCFANDHWVLVEPCLWSCIGLCI